ncbi:MAG TPA: DUF72 domain-containing protein [Acidimicrobiia bacterium]|jgi:uncharacterized protein YecE (DUF72 family)
MSPRKRRDTADGNGDAGEDDRFHPEGPAWGLEDRGLLVGVTAWTEPTLVKSRLFYPEDVTSAEDRLRFYASRFPITEVDATYYAPPATTVADAWARRTPDQFVFDVKAYRYLTEHPTPPGSLWKDLRSELPDDLAKKRNVYPKDLPADFYDEVMRRFLAALTPLREAGKLGVILFQFPQWFVPSRHAFDRMAQIAEAAAPDRVAVEFRQHLWLDDRHAETTLNFLTEHDLAYVAVDEPQGFTTSVPPVAAATVEDVAVVRFHGRNAETWEKKGVTAAERFAYDYPDDELRGWTSRLATLRDQAASVHALMNNCYADYGVRNGARLATLLGEQE